MVYKSDEGISDFSHATYTLFFMKEKILDTLRQNYEGYSDDTLLEAFGQSGHDKLLSLRRRGDSSAIKGSDAEVREQGSRGVDEGKGGGSMHRAGKNTDGRDRGDDEDKPMGGDARVADETDSGGGGSTSLLDQANYAIKVCGGKYPELDPHCNYTDEVKNWGDSSSGSSSVSEDFSNLRFSSHNDKLFEITLGELLQFNVSKIQCRDEKLFSELSDFISQKPESLKRFDCKGQYKYVTGMPSKGRWETASLNLAPLLGSDLPSQEVLNIIGVGPEDEADYKGRIGPQNQLLVTWVEEKRGVAYARQALADFVHFLRWDGFLSIDDDIRRVCKRGRDGTFDITSNHLGAFLIEVTSVVNQFEPLEPHDPLHIVSPRDVPEFDVLPDVPPRVAMIGTTVFNGVNGRPPAGDYLPQIHVNKFVHRVAYFNLAALMAKEVKYEVDNNECRYTKEDVYHAKSAYISGLLLLKSDEYMTVYNNRTDLGGVSQSKLDAANAGLVPTPVQHLGQLFFSHFA